MGTRVVSCDLFLEKPIMDVETLEAFSYIKQSIVRFILCEAYWLCYDLIDPQVISATISHFNG